MKTRTANWMLIGTIGAIVLAAPLYAQNAAVSSTFFSVMQHGAKGDGVTLDTAAIQKAIDAAHEAGGGTVLFPPGAYLSGSLFMKSRVTLYLEAGATLLGSKNLEDFTEVSPAFRSYTENYVVRSLIYGENLENISILGRGTIDGQGAAFPRDSGYLNRPYVIRFVSCRDITVQNVTLMNSPMWMQLYLACDDVVIHGIHVESNVNANNDGINIDCCRNVRISDCFIHSGDDAIVLKSTGDRTCENVTVTNCVLSTICNAFKLGTESVGGFRNITASNLTIRKPGLEEDWDRSRRGLAGIAIMTVDGGILERVSISNVTMRGMTAAIFLRLGNRARPISKDHPKPGIGQFRDVSISHVTARDISKIGCSVTGLPGHAVENIRIEDIDICMEGGGATEDVTREVPENPEKYPESSMFGVLPSYGFYCRHVNGLSFRDIDVRWEERDVRPALVCDDVRNLTIDGYDGMGGVDGALTMRFNHVLKAMVRGCVAPSGAAAFLRLQGGCQRISLTGNDLSEARMPVEFGEGVSEDVLFAESNRLNR